MSSRNSKAFKFPGLETSHASLVVVGDEDDVTVDVLLFFVVIFRFGTTGQRPTAAREDMCSQREKK
jgi:hypothetical protein